VSLDSPKLRDDLIISDRPGAESVIKNPDTWVPDDFDSWGRGLGVGIVIEPPFPLGDTDVDVRWPAGRCFESIHGLLPAPAELCGP